MVTGVQTCALPIFPTLANIADISVLKPKFKLDPTISYKTLSHFFTGFEVKTKTIKVEFKDGNKTLSVKSSDASSWNEFNPENLYIGEGKHSRLKDYYISKYLCNNITATTAGIDNFEPAQFTYIYPTNYETLLENLESDFTLTDVEKAATKAQYLKEYKYQQTLLKYLKVSAFYKDYEAIVVPDQISVNLNKEEETLSDKDIQTLAINETPEERRARMSSIVAYTIRTEKASRWGNDIDYIYDKIEPILQDVITSEVPTYYCTDENKDLMMAAAQILDKTSNAIAMHYVMDGIYHDNNRRTFFVEAQSENSRSSRSSVKELNTIKLPTDFVQLIKVSKKNLRHVELNSNWRPIEEFFIRYTDTGIATSPLIKKLFTIQKVVTHVSEDVNFLFKTEWDISDSINILSMIDSSLAYILELIDFNTYDSSKGLYNIIPSEVRDKLDNMYIFSQLPNDPEVKEELSKKFFIFSDMEIADVFDQFLFDTVCMVNQLGAGCENLLKGTVEISQKTDDVVNLVKDYYSYLTEYKQFAVPYPDNTTSFKEVLEVLEVLQK
jgi:hypothetical protein